jgi:hypothetical protein
MTAEETGGRNFERMKGGRQVGYEKRNSRVRRPAIPWTTLAFHDLIVNR